MSQGQGTGTDPKLPPDINTNVAHPARVYDYWLGGKDSFPADRALAEHMIQAIPNMRAMAAANRAFLSGRSATWPARLGSASSWTSAPVSRPAPTCTRWPRRPSGYQGRLRRQRPGRPRPCPRPADQRERRGDGVHHGRPARAQVHPRPSDPDGDPRPAPAGGGRAGRGAHVLPRQRRPQPLRDGGGHSGAAAVRQLPGRHPPDARLQPGGDGQGGRRRRGGPGHLVPRTKAEIERFFTGLDLVDPGLTPVLSWRPDEPPADPHVAYYWAGIARKP